jgi:hypothetical protein
MHEPYSSYSSRVTFMILAQPCISSLMISWLQQPLVGHNASSFVPIWSTSTMKELISTCLDLVATID